MYQDREDIIFRLLKQKKTAHEIDEVLTKRRERKKGMVQRGIDSEKSIIQRLKKLDCVLEVVPFAKNSGHDKAGHDMKIFFKHKELSDFLGETPTIQNVFVQSKSSDEKVSEFRAKYGDSDKEINQQLAEEKIVVLNARVNDEDLLSDFTRQVKYINQYWKD